MSDAPAGDPRELMARALHELRRAQARIDELEARQHAEIALVGAACELPGGVAGPDDLWRLLRAGVDATGQVPADRWDVERYWDPEPGRRGRIAPRRGAFLPRIDGFDAGFFGIAPAEAELMDPQQRLLLECGWHAFEDAGVATASLRDAPVGVFVGISTVDYAYHLVQRVPPDEVSAHCGTGTTHAVAAGRLAYCLDLRGPCLALDTACSSSLVALHLACQSLRRGECEFALVAGVNAMLSPLTPVSFSHARMLAPDGRCKTFAAAADGYARGEGVVALLLTRSATAAARGLRVRAEVLGTATNQDGRSAALTVPNGPAQVAVVRSALADARIEPGAVDYVEAHGTGTALGDPIELHALGQVFGADRPDGRPLRVGSIKTNLGHTEAAAGALSVLKVALQLQHGEIAPHLHFDRPNPHIDWSALPIEVPTSAAAWPHAGPRHAGVSSFGFSGTNAHAVLRAVPASDAERVAVPEGAVLALPVSAHDEAALRSLAAACAGRLDQGDLAAALDLCFTMARGRNALRVRAVALGRSPAALATALRRLEPGDVLGGDVDPVLGEAARAFAARRADAGALADHLAALGARLGDAPCYPFQRQRHWYDGAAESGPPLQRLTETWIDLPPTERAPRELSVHVQGSVSAALRRSLENLGARLDADAATADLWLHAVPTAETADATVAAVQDLLATLRRAARRAQAPRLAVLVPAAAAPTAPAALAARAALRAAAVELPALQPRWVAPGEVATADAVAAALLETDDETECEVHGVSRRAVRWTAVADQMAPAAPAVAVHADRSYLVTGGTGALGRAVAADLLARGAGAVWLWSRSGGPVPAGLQDDAAARGAQVRALAVDVGDPAAVQRGLLAIAADGPALAGVYHLAGTAQDARLADLDAARIDEQLRPKLRGAFALDAALGETALDAFVCVSSAAAWLGNEGQAAYAAANGAVEGLVRARRARGLRATAVAFGPWNGDGLAARPGVAHRLAAHGVHRLDPAAALAALGAQQAAGVDEAALVRVEWPLLARAVPRAPARMRSLGGVRADVPRRAVPTALRGAPLERAVADAVARVLGRWPGEVAVDAPLAQLGLDSLLAVDLQQRVRQDLGLELPLSAMLGAEDSRGLAAAALAATATATVPAEPGAGADAAADDGALLDLVHDLSDDEVRAMLDADRTDAP
ncbi:MAG: SDR family NAD(P)-dependent oxidoreductase [Planctomycetota bacterium]